MLTGMRCSLTRSYKGEALALEARSARLDHDRAPNRLLHLLRCFTSRA